MIRDFVEDAHNVSQILCTFRFPPLSLLILMSPACATTIHNIPKSDLEVVRFLVSTVNRGQEKWKACLVHPSGMRKVLAQTEPMDQERQAVDVLLRMVRVQVRDRLFRDGGMRW